MPAYLEIAVNVPRISGVFHYHLPDNLTAKVQPGHLVLVEFGKQTVQGVVLRGIAEPEVAETKPVIAIVDDGVVLTPAQIELARHISQHSLAPLAVCVGLMLPAGISKQADTLYILNPAKEDGGTLTTMSPVQTRIVALLKKRGPLRGRQIEHTFAKDLRWRPVMSSLLKNGTIISEPVLPLPTIRPKHVRTAQLSAPPEKVLAEIDELGSRPQTKARRRKVMQFLLKEPEPVAVEWVYAQSGGNLADLQILNQRGLLLLREQEIFRDPLSDLAYDPSVAPTLTEHQAAVWKQVQATLTNAATNPPPPILLHGVTGSGKTEIYLRAVEETLTQGRQAIVLVPEISLTPQPVRRFVSRFPGRVGVLHSGLSTGERYDTWRRARAGQLSVIVGPRSALFAPLPDIGLIVVDESHDQSYYQSERSPYYHARAVAIAYAHLTGAVCLLGSATPDLVSYQHASSGKWELLELPSRILAHRETIQKHDEKLGKPSVYESAGEQVQMTELPPVDIVDMREELKSGNRSIF
ncbi:MAG: DEAD/DEAH box helicase family protein, partial [Chloroflexota bacterium]